jgi:hypothetical protein
MLSLRKRADKTGEPPPDGEAWPLRHVELVGDAPKDHNFADTFVTRALTDGYLSFKNPRGVASDAGGVPYSRNPVVTGDEIVLALKGGKLRYRVLEPPGRYEDKDGTVRESHEYRCRLIGGK